MSQPLSLSLRNAARRRDHSRNQAMQTTHLRTGASLLRNVENLAQVYGLPCLGFMTLTFRDSLSPYAAVKRLRKLVRKFNLLFKAWCWVLEFGPGCRIHFHLVVVCHHDISTGFDAAAYDTLKGLTTQCRAEGRQLSPQETLLAHALKRSLKTNVALKAVQKDVRKLLQSTKAGFGYHFELTPIRKTPADLGEYFRKNYFRAVQARHRRYPGVHLTASSKSFPRIWNSSFALVNSCARFDYKAIGDALAVPDAVAMAKRFGPRWARALEPVIDELRCQHSKYPSLWPEHAIREAVEAHLGEGLI